MRYLLVTSFCLLSLLTKAVQVDTFDRFDAFLKEVVIEGRVDYDQVRKDTISRNWLLKTIANETLLDADLNTKKAFLINAYNILVILDLAQAQKPSPLDIPGFFESTKHQLAGEAVTLNELEKERLLPLDNDARLHFVLVCGAKGCPPLASFAFRPEQLNEQLKAQTTIAASALVMVRLDPVDKTVELSQIFDWYQADFDKAGGAIKLLNAHRSTAIPADYKITFAKEYDWSLNSLTTSTTNNLKTYTPSILLSKSKMEFKIFNNLYTQTQKFLPVIGKTDIGARETFFTSTVQYLYGVSKNAKLNVGFDLNITAVFLDTASGNPLAVFGETSSQHARTALTSIGPKIKWAPTSSSFSVQSAFWIPTASDSESAPWLAYDRYTWWTQFFYDRTFKQNWQLFTEFDLLFRIPKNETQDVVFSTPTSIFLSYFVTNKNTIYGMFQASPTFGNTPDGSAGIASYYAQYGLGTKYQLTPQLELEALVSDFFAGSNWAGAGSTFNLGLRVIW